MKAAPSFIPKRVAARLGQLPSLAIAVSGGGDSMALLHFMQSHHAPDQSLTALTVDHGLRSTSAAEASQVKRWCKAMGVKHRTLKWHHGEIKTGIQAKARAARYALLTAYCARHKISALLTAHTRDDQAETVAMRMTRTMSDKSIAGIWPETEIAGVKILRPLLSMPRKRLRDYLTAQGQDWLEDPSNQDQRFERVRWRSVGVAPALAAAATKAQAKMKRATAQAEAWLAAHACRDASAMITFDAKRFNALADAVKDEALLQLIAMAGGKVPERAKRVALLEWLATGNATRRSLGGVIFNLRKSTVLMAREPGRIAQNLQPLSPSQTVLWDNRFLASGPKGSTITFKGKVKALKRISELPAFVDQGLPVILAAGEVLATPHFSNHPQARLTLLQK